MDTPEVDTTGKQNPKGTFIGCNIHGKLNTKAGRGVFGAWIMHELKNKQVVLEPLSNSGRFLRMFPNGKVNLTNVGAGQRARWRITKNSNVVQLNDIHKKDVIVLESLFAKDLVMGVSAELNKHNIMKLKVKGIPKNETVQQPTPISFISLTVEEVDPSKMLTRMAQKKKRSAPRAPHRRQHSLCLKKHVNPAKKMKYNLAKLNI